MEIIFIIICIIVITLLLVFVINRPMRECEIQPHYQSFRQSSADNDNKKRSNFTVEDIQKYKQRENLRIGVVSVSIGNRKFSQLSKARLEEYCQRHNYTLEYFTQTVDPRYAIMWQKTCAIKEVLGKYDAVLFLDDDILITNTNVKVEQYIESINHDIIFGGDTNDYSFINTGAIILKNTPIARMYIEELLEGYELFGGKYKEELYHEQTITNYLYMTKYHPYMAVLPQRVLQSYHSNPHNSKMDVEWQPGDFCIHLCGKSASARERIFKELYKWR